MNPNEFLTAKQILEIAYPECGKVSLGILPRNSAPFNELQKQLLIIEKEQCNFDFKIGVLLVKKDQTHEDEFFANSKNYFF